MVSQRMKRRALELIGELITNRQGKRFASFIHSLQMMGYVIRKPPAPEEWRLVDAMYYLDRLNYCEANFDVWGYSFYFNLLRLSFSDVMALIEKIQEKDTYRLQDLTISDPVVMDVGAHIGVFSRYVLHEKPKATVYALEPDRDNFKLLTMNLKPFGQAFCVQKGVLDKKDTLELYTSKKIDWRSSLMIKEGFKDKLEFEPEEYMNAYRVEVTDIDSFIAESGLSKLDLLKLTVPGEIEPLVLAGAGQAIKKFRPQISLYVYPANMLKVGVFFKDIGGYQEITPADDSIPAGYRIFQPLEHY